MRKEQVIGMLFFVSSVVILTGVAFVLTRVISLPPLASAATLSGVVVSSTGSGLEGSVISTTTSHLRAHVVSDASAVLGGVVTDNDRLDVRMRHYPHASPTRWYILPGDSFGFFGIGFVPGERIQIVDQDGGIIDAMADDAGNFNAPSVLTVPFEWQHGTRSFTVRGVQSQWSSAFTVVIGTFYPQINPSVYWIGVNQPMNVSGVSFAPGETVRMIVNGNEVARTTADEAGNVYFNIVTPASGTSASITAQGTASGLSSTRVIYMHL